MKKQAQDSRAPPCDQADLFGASHPPARPERPPPGPRSSFAKRPPAPARTPPNNAPAPNALLNVRQAAERLGLSKSTLDKMRCAGKGPRFIKSTDRAVRYDPADLDAWITARRRSSTD
jgi:predicted DNA-binding transcriptional regulator AlpA